MLFVDTSGWFAFFMPLDANHQRVRAHLERPAESLITTDYCIDETLTLLLARGEAHRALRAGRGFFHDNLAEIHFVTPQQIQRAWIRFSSGPALAGALPIARARL
jgi:predicted nucleic acid-binding protein